MIYRIIYAAYHKNDNIIKQEVAYSEGNTRKEAWNNLRDQLYEEDIRQGNNTMSNLFRCKMYSCRKMTMKHLEALYHVEESRQNPDYKNALNAVLKNESHVAVDRSVAVTAMPYATQYGTIKVPRNVTGEQAVRTYIEEHFNEIRFEAAILDYAGTEIEIDDDMTEQNAVA